MSNSNPYTPVQNIPIDDSMIGRVAIQPIELLKRSYALIGDQYWLFLGIVLVGIFLGSLVPFGILLGPFLVGIYMCFIQREQGQRVEFATLFKGFDLFMNAFVAVLIMMGISLLVLTPLLIVFFVMVISMISLQEGDPSIAFFVVIALFYLAILLASILVYIPFVFTFQLIADRGLSAGQAVWTSWQGVRSNLWGVLWFMFVVMVISLLCAIMCYVPLLLFMPIAIGAYYLLYRDIYGPRPGVG